MRKLLECLTGHGIPVDFVGEAPPDDPSYSIQLEAMGIQVRTGMGEARTLLSDTGGEYRAVLLSRPEVAEAFLPLVRSTCPAARVIYDTVDLHWVRFATGARLDASDGDLALKAEAYRRIELANARAADLTLSITPEERATLLSEDSDLKVEVLPNVHEVSSMVPGFESRRDLFFIGGFEHRPNVDAVRFFVAEILPTILLSRPEVRFHIVGSKMPPEIWALRSDAVDPVGYVADVTPYFASSRVFVAPLRQGAGMKGKIGHSLGFGLPVVTSRIGAEGLGLSDGVDAFIADQPGEFASKVISLYTNPDLWAELSCRGQELIRARFSRAHVCAKLVEIIGGARAPPYESAPAASDGPSVTR
jgi:glycosyltransferase involved in cell wall biosynthesis